MLNALSAPLARRLFPVLVTGVFCLARIATAAPPPQPDDFDLLRRRWLTSLVGDEQFDPKAPEVRQQVEAQAREASALWESMAKTPGEDLWPPLQTATRSGSVSTTAQRLSVMARAYATPGSTLHRNPALRDDLLNALRWFAAARYHPGAKPYDNWWDWEIGVPLALLPCLACVYDDLPAATLTACTDAIESFTPVISATGANGGWRADILLRRGILVKDAAKIETARDWLGATMFAYREPPQDPASAPEGFSEGFYRDGSFFAHNRNPYNTGYGLGALDTAVHLVALLAGTRWEVTGPNRDHVYDWIVNSYEPLLFRGAFFDNTRGREITRGRVADTRPAASPRILEFLLTAGEVAPASYRQAFRGFAKGIALRGDRAVRDSLPARAAARLAALLADPSVAATSPATLFRHYPLMARTVMLRESFGASVSMYSDSVYDYESLNNENLRGWHTSDGWLQILDGDWTQFSDNFWPTVDWHRLPGTTTVRGSTKPSSRVNGSSWAGGADLDGVNGVTGFELRPFSGEIYDPGSKTMLPATDGQTLTARKSWFMLGDEIFCVGSGIVANDDAPVETTLANHRLTEPGDNALTADGHRLASAPDRDVEVTARWLHLAGNVPGSSLGCVFTGPTRVQTRRESRTGSWRSITEGPTVDPTPVTRRFLTLWLDHGIRPAGATYAYVLLPGRNPAAVEHYAADPPSRLLAATGKVHAVAQRETGIIAANFWEDAPAALALDGARKLTVEQKACVLYRYRAGVTELAVSDPTRANRSAIHLTFNVPLGRRLVGDDRLRAEPSPDGGTIVTLDLSHLAPEEPGRTFKLKLAD